MKFFHKRKIKEVASWDGSASNYSTAEAYAKASLVNFNTGSPDTWVKDLIKLPVRNEGDAQDVYIKQAVQAAAGGRGITRVTKPDGISQEVFSEKIKSAANKIIAAYRQWDEYAPDSVYEIAGKEAPVERVIAFSDIYNEVSDILTLADMAENKLTKLYDVYYDEDKGMFYAIAIRDGEVYKIEIFTNGSAVSIGEFIELTPEYEDENEDEVEPPYEQRLRVYRSETGEMRWLSISSVAVLNRVGEIDSRELYDSFIDYANRTGNFPDVSVYHLGERSVVGKADILARHEYAYITGGTFTDDKFGRATFEGLKNRSDWGNSIEFYSPRYYIETFKLNGAVIQARVYKRGINTGITLVREKDAASMFTLHKVRG